MARFGLYLAVVAALAGCTGRSALDDEVVSSNPSALQANPADPFGACVPGGDATFPLQCSHAKVACTGAGVGPGCGPSGCAAGVFHVMCNNPCQVDADCPVPLTGTARASCHPQAHFCRLVCAADADCPDGFTCQDGTMWLARDPAGSSLGLPHMCMQTITID